MKPQRYKKRFLVYSLVFQFYCSGGLIGFLLLSRRKRPETFPFSFPNAIAIRSRRTSALRQDSRHSSISIQRLVIEFRELASITSGVASSSRVTRSIILEAAAAK